MLNRVSFALQQQVFCIKVACEHALQWGKSAKINQRAKRAERRLENRKGLSLWRKFSCRVPFQGTRCALDPSAISYRSDHRCWHVWLTNPFGQRICISCPKVMNITSPCERVFFIRTSSSKKNWAILFRWRRNRNTAYELWKIERLFWEFFTLDLGKVWFSKIFYASSKRVKTRFLIRHLEVKRI